LISISRPDGTIFKAPAEIHTPIRRGDVVTFVFENYSKISNPVNPKIVRKRTDVSWNNVLRDFQRELRKDPNGLLPPKFRHHARAFKLTSKDSEAVFSFFFFFLSKTSPKLPFPISPCLLYILFFVNLIQKAPRASLEARPHGPRRTVMRLFFDNIPLPFPFSPLALYFVLLH
jgi:hypothetical protein